MAFTIGTVKIRIGADSSTLGRDLRDASQQLQRSSANFKNIGAAMSQAITLPLGLVGIGALKTAGDIEALQKGLLAVMGTSQAVSAEFEKLREVAKLPGLGLEEAVQGSVALQAAGFSADEARESLLAFGNALATVGKGKAELSLVQLALTQLQNKTSGYGQEIRQLTEQLPQLRGALKSAFGTSDSEAIAKLGITGKDVVAILTQEFAKLPKVAGGLKNAFENAGDSIKIALFKVGDSINKNFKIEQLIEKVSNKLVALADAFGRLSPQTQKIILTLAGIAAAAGPVIFVIGAIQSSIGTLTLLFSRFVIGGVSGMTGLVTAMGPVGIAVLAIGAAVAATIYYWDDLNAAFNKAYQSSETFRAAIAAVKLTLVALKAPIDAAIGAFYVLASTVSNTWEAIKGNISFKDALSNIANDAYATGVTIGNNLKEGVTNAFKVDLSRITGIQSPTGDRRDSFKKLNELKNKPKVSGISIPKAGGGSGTGKPIEQFSKIDEIADFNSKTISIPMTIIPMSDKELQNKIVIPTTESLTDGFGKAFSEIDPIADFNSKMLTIPTTASIVSEAIVSSMKSVSEAIGESLTKIGLILEPLNAAFNTITSGQEQAISNKEAKEIAAANKSIGTEEQKNARITAIEKKYQDQRAKLQRKQAIANKITGIFNATVSMFAGVGKAIELGPAGLPLIPLIKGLGLANIAAIAATPLPSLAIGTNRVLTDGIAQIHKGEAIVPAKVVEGGFVNKVAQQAQRLAVEVYGSLRGNDLVLATQYSQNEISRLRP